MNYEKASTCSNLSSLILPNCQSYSSHVYFSSPLGHCIHAGICVCPSTNTSLHPLLSCLQESECTYGVVMDIQYFCFSTLVMYEVIGLVVFLTPREQSEICPCHMSLSAAMSVTIHLPAGCYVRRAVEGNGLERSWLEV